MIEDDPSAARLLRDVPRGRRLRGPRRARRRDGPRRRPGGTPPAAIILDVLLPGIDGWEVLRRLKADDDLRDIPVIIVTVVDEREVGLALGAVDYFVKPVERDGAPDRLGALHVHDQGRDAARCASWPSTTTRPRSTSSTRPCEPEGFTVRTALRAAARRIDLARREASTSSICDS